MPLLRRSSAPENTPDPDAQASVPEPSDKKGRPTPKRKEAEAANRRPLVAGDRKSATKAARSKAREERDLEYSAMKTGDKAHYPLRDRGPVRDYIREYVDARWNVGEYFLIVAMVLMVASLVLSSVAKSGALLVGAYVAMLLIYVIGIVALVDTYLMWRFLKKRLVAKFGFDRMERGLGMYAAGRALQFRRWRMPRPTQAKHGVYPD